MLYLFVHDVSEVGKEAQCDDFSQFFMHVTQENNSYSEQNNMIGMRHY